jgi:hypothetical protein
MWAKRNAYRILVGNPEGKRPLGRRRPKWVDSIKIDFRDIGWDGMDWIDLAQDRDQWRALVNTVWDVAIYIYIYIYMQRQPLVELFDNIYYNRTVYTDVLE